ncbi:peptidoglycan/LPS O-acetylase OafA/YrhL [Methylorubrum rhodinum]|uniref:Peptidoglycan/LPS O-acetylase OafA/YrhL n=1 Tax=Methylorubrum rhodinum TaxID=29428 RepID=A0A840ZPR1_9HYPH|nr:acyltransferase [Methylorubrum rhodinum]MBB5760262.1 peptidoglycan/LPS O-acetylase OafA/YrhL [Methylorubrum rhodinum]
MRADELNRRPGSPHPPVARLDALTALRFPAAAGVVAYHYQNLLHPAGPAPSIGWAAYGAVTFFFVLSGFILTHNYRSVGFDQPAARHAFYRARIARIFPLYLVSIGLALPFFAAHLAKLAPVPPLMAASGLLTPLGLQAWLPGAACALNCPAWSVSAELTFYALFPFLLPPLLRRPGRGALVLLLAWCVMGVAASLAWDARAAGASLLAPEPAGPDAALLAQFIKFNPLLRLPEFLFGIVLYAVWQRRAVAPPVLLALALAVGMALGLVAAAPSIPEPVMHNGLTALVAAPLILAAAAIRGGPLTWPPLVFLGKISFACYLLHVPASAAIQALDRIAADGVLRAHPWAGLVLACALTLAASALLHLRLEEPARRLILRSAARPAISAGRERA